MTRLEQQIMEFLADGDQLLSEKDICSHFYTETKRSIINALNNLEKSGKLYSIDSFVGKMYGIDSTEEPEIVSLSDVISDSIKTYANIKSSFVVLFPKHISEIDSSYLNINDTKYKTSKLTKKFMNEWFDLIESHKTYLRNLKIKTIESIQESVTRTSGGMDFNAFAAMKALLKVELEELASIRSMYLSEIVETANAVLKNNPSSDKIDEFLRFVYSNFDYDEEDVTFNGGQDRVYVPVPKVNELRKSVIKPNNIETASKSNMKSFLNDKEPGLSEKNFIDLQAERRKKLMEFARERETAKEIEKEKAKKAKQEKDYAVSLMKQLWSFAVHKYQMNDEIVKLRKQLPSEDEQKKLDQLSDNIEKLTDDIAQIENQNCEFTDRIANLHRERSSLGLFSGKKKREIDDEVNRLETTIRRNTIQLNELKKQSMGCNTLEEYQCRVTKVHRISEEINAILSSIKSIDESAKKITDELKMTDVGKKELSFITNIKECKVGDTIAFGKYQKQNIKWKVLSVENDKALVITDKAIDVRPYHKSGDNTYLTWEKSEMRDWLNTELYNEAFDTDTKNMILTTLVIPDSNPKYKIFPGNETRDKVFLLSITEAIQYFNNDADRLCFATKYACSKNPKYISLGKGCSWWLRTSGRDNENATTVRSDNGQIECWGAITFSNYIAVRPAVWIDLNFFDFDL